MDNYTPDPFNNGQNSNDGSGNYVNSDYTDIYSNNTNAGTNANEQNTYNNGAYNQNGYDNSAYNQNSYNNGAYNQNYNNGAYNQNYNNGAYNQNYNNGAYNQNGYNNGAYNQNGYNNGAYNQNGYNNTGYNQNYNNYNGYNYTNIAPSNFPSYTAYLTLSIISICLASWIFGLIALLSTTGANTAFKSGNYEQYESSRKRAKVMLIISLVWAIIQFILGFMLGFSGVLS